MSFFDSEIKIKRDLNFSVFNYFSSLKLEISMKFVKIILVILFIILVIIQFFPPEKNKSEMIAQADITNVTNIPENVANTLQTACYNCHSNNTEYPWYDNIAPVSYWMASHIKGGKKDLNFSKFGDYSKKRQLHKLDEVAELAQKRIMPLESYTWMHDEAKLSNQQIKELIQWIDAYTVAHQLKDIPQ